MLRITLVRHGQSEANHAGLWQGQGDSDLSAEGREQAKRLADRLAGRRFDLVLASDLTRARETAAALGHEIEIDPRWREMNLGGWEGRTFEEVQKLHPDLLAAIRRGEAVAFGGTGETLAEFEQRALEAVETLAERVGEGEVLVVTHGGVIDAIAGRALGRLPDRRTFPVVSNTSLTVLEGEPGRLRLQMFNDATHIAPEVGFLARMREEGVPIAGFVRHGITQANKERRIQGQSCWGLDDDGRSQARDFASWYGPVDRIITSPLQRARETAAAFGLEPEEEPGVQEMAFGEWEGKLYQDLQESADELARRVYVDGEDLPRGHTGESFAQLIDRMGAFLSSFTPDPGQRTLVVSHGAAIRALVASISGHAEVVNTLGTPDNTAVTHIAFTEEGPMIADYAIAPHLETRVTAAR